MCCCDLDRKRGPLSLWMALIEIHLPHKCYESPKTLAVTSLCADFLGFFLVQGRKLCVKSLPVSGVGRGFVLAGISLRFRQPDLLSCLNIQQKYSRVTLISPAKELICNLSVLTHG